MIKWLINNFVKVKFVRKIIFKKSYTTLCIGDMLVHHCLVLHGSNPNNSNLNRIGWTFQFKAKSAKYNLKKILKYEKQLNDQIYV